MSTRDIVDTFKELYGADVSESLISKVTDAVMDRVTEWQSRPLDAIFWLNVLTELQNRGVQDILIACVDGLKGFPDAINTVFPQTQIQLCVVHMVRNAMKYVPYKDYKAVASCLKAVYQSVTEE